MYEIEVKGDDEHEKFGDAADVDGYLLCVKILQQSAINRMLLQ